MRSRAIRDMFQAHIREAQDNNRDYRAGCMAFLRSWNEQLGLNPDAQGGQDTYLTEDFRPVWGIDGRMKPSEVTISALAEAIIGRDTLQDLYGANSGFEVASLREAAIDPTAFLNINLFNLATAGLVNARIMEAFVSPQYIGKDLVTTVPTNMNGHKIIGVTGIAPQTAAAKARAPGASHASVGLGEAWQTTPETTEQALKVEITKEAVFFEQATGEIMQKANMIGDELAYGQEKDIARIVTGVTNNYNRNGTSYDTYQASTPWINTHTNEFSDETDVDDARALLLGMTDPDTGREIDITVSTILCSPYRELTFREQLFGTQVSLQTQISSSVAGRMKLTSSQINQVAKGTLNLLPLTQIWHNILVASSPDGLGLTATQAKGYWWWGDFKKAFEWHENWPLTPWQAAATELTMKDRGLIAVHGANYRGVAYSREPRYAIRNTKA